ncbi:hypothetical protein [Trueperella sp. LYQ141]|uniref:hypothetical protein n=1 Tax=Trueperella sp. LYQ141 TaxID=3391058 RepID=UPI003983D44E
MTAQSSSSSRYWFNIRTGEVASSDTPLWSALECMGPYPSAVAARDAYLISTARNMCADYAEEEWQHRDDDEFDREQRRWERNW